MPMKRFKVAEDSMRPALEPGQEFVASDSIVPGVDDIVSFEHPHRPGFWLVKRRSTPPAAISRDEMWVRSDNLEAEGIDSDTLGPIEIAGSFTMIERLNDPLFREAVALLSSEDPGLAAIVEQHGLPEFWHREAHFRTLVLLILEQQVSLESGDAMYRRLIDRCCEVSPRSLLEAGESMREIGVTRQKTGYIIGLAEAVINGSLDLEGLTELSPEIARAELTSVKGIGNWTADAYLLSAVGHIDIWPVGDRALRVGAGEVVGMNTVPTEDQLEMLAEPWRPLRAVSARLIWHNYLAVRGRKEPPDPTRT